MRFPSFIGWSCLAVLVVGYFHPLNQVDLCRSIGCINVHSLRHCRLNGLPIDLSGMASTFATAQKKEDEENDGKNMKGKKD